MQKRLLVPFTALFLLVGLGVYIFFDLASNNDSANNPGDSEQVVDNSDGGPELDQILNDDLSGIGVVADTDGDGIIEEYLPDTVSFDSYPSLDRSFTIPASFPADAVQIMRSNINEVVGRLKEDRKDISEWISLAVLLKTIDDYLGAAEIWEFLGRELPTNTVTFANLGSLYHLHLKDYPKSELNFRKAIENNRTNPALYLGLHELYKYSYKTETGLAQDVLKEGLQHITDNTDLLITSARFAHERGEIDQAVVYYTRARDVAEESGNSKLVGQIDRDLVPLLNME